MSYVMQLFRADTRVALDTRETLFRLVHIEHIAGTFSGTFSVPAFDANESGGVFTGAGFFYVQYDIQNRSNNPILNVAGDQPIHGATVLPSLAWDNTTKLMTVTPASIPADWPFFTRPNYDIIFCHFR